MAQMLCRDHSIWQSLRRSARARSTVFFASARAALSAFVNNDEHLARRMLAARRHALLGPTRMDEPLFDEHSAVVRFDDWEYCLACRAWTESGRAGGLSHREAMVTLRLVERQERAMLLAQRAQMLLDRMRTMVAPARGGMPDLRLKPRSRTPKRSSRSSGGPGIRLVPRLSDQVESSQQSDIIHVLENFMVKNGQWWYLVCRRWSDEQHQRSRRHIERVYQFMSLHPMERKRRTSWSWSRTTWSILLVCTNMISFQGGIKLSDLRIALSELNQS